MMYADFTDGLLTEVDEELRKFREDGDKKGMYLAQAVKEYMYISDEIDSMLESLMETVGGDYTKAQSVATYLTMVRQGVSVFKAQLTKGGEKE